MYRISSGLPGPLQKSPPEDASVAPASGRQAAKPNIPVAARIVQRANRNLSQDDMPKVRRPLPPEVLRGPAVAAAVQRPGIAARMQELKDYLAELRWTHAQRRELLRCRDTEFLDLLVAMENDRDPSLRLSAHIVDSAVLGDDWNATLKATTGLARAATEGMDHGAWHAVVSIDGHEVALSARHDVDNPSRLSLIVVDSLGKNFETRVWKQISGALCHHLNKALGMEDKAADAKVWVSCLNTSTQITGDGGAIFALYALREMPSDLGIEQLHAEMRSAQAAHHAPAAARMFDGKRHLGARYFKLMAQKLSMDDLLAQRPDLEDVMVNQKGDTLRTYQSAHLVSHQPRHGPSFEHSDAYERKRLGAYERLIEHIEIAAVPKSSPARNGVFKTESSAPEQEETPESLQTSKLKSSLKCKLDPNEKSSVPSSKASAQRNSDVKSSRRAGRRSEQRKSQNDAEKKNRQSSVDAGRRDSKSHDKARKEVSPPHSEREDGTGPDVKHVQSAKIQGQPGLQQDGGKPRTSLNLNQASDQPPHDVAHHQDDHYKARGPFKNNLVIDEKSSVHSEHTFKPADGSVFGPHQSKQVRAAERDFDGEPSRRVGRSSERQASQNDDELRGPSSVDAGYHSGWHGKAPMEDSSYYAARGDVAVPNVTRMHAPPVSKHVRFEDVPYQGVPYRPGLAQGREYQPVGDHRSGFSGPTVVPQPTPVLNALLAKLHEATVSRNTNFAPQPVFQRGCGNTLQEQVAARGSLYDYSMPLYGDPQIDESFNQLTIQKRNADNLRALKTRYPIRTEGETLKGMLDLTKNFSKKIYEDMRGIGHMMYRQEVINELAERAAEANRQDNESNVDKSAPYKEEDPHLIALVYQSIVADELRILPILDVTNELKTNPAFQDVFASVIPPDRLDFFRTRLLGEVFEEESKQAKVDDFLNGLEFLNTYRKWHGSSVMLSWNAKYPKHF